MQWKGNVGEGEVSTVLSLDLSLCPWDLTFTGAFQIIFPIR